MPPKDSKTRKLIQKRYRQTHAERRAEYNKEWKSKNPELSAAKNKRGTLRRDREKKRAYMRVYNNLSPMERVVWSDTKRQRKRFQQEAAKVGKALGRWPNSFVRYLSPNERRIWTNLYNRRLRARNPQYLIGHRLRAKLAQSLRKAGAKKCARTFELVGCSTKHLVRHIEKLFLPGMTWENRQLWHIDHIVPLSAFDLRQRSDQRKAMHFRNLRPLWREDNREKWDLLPDGTLARNRTRQHYLPGF